MIVNKVKFFLDTEFIELGRNHPLELLSIGIVCENRNTFYAETLDVNFDIANDWVKENVYPHFKHTVDFKQNLNNDLRKDTNGNMIEEIDGRLDFRSENNLFLISELAKEIVWFVYNNCGIDYKYQYDSNFQWPKDLAKPEFWGYFADYDWVIFCQLFGTMMDLPKGFPYYCNDLKQLMKFYGIDESLDELTKQESNHNALDDAKQIKKGYEIIQHSTTYGIKPRSDITQLKPIKVD